MTQSDVRARITQNPKFKELVSKRTRLAFSLSLLVLVPFYIYMFLTSTAPALFTKPISEGGVITVGWPIAAAFVVGSWLLTGVYVWRANGEFDELSKEILKEVSK